MICNAPKPTYHIDRENQHLAYSPIWLNGKELYTDLSKLREINEFRDKNYWNRIKNIH